MSQRQITRFVPERTEDNDPDLWPEGWDVGPHPAIAGVAPEWIEPRLLSYYKRTQAADDEVREYYERGPRNQVTGELEPVLVADEHNLLHRNGLPISLNPATNQGMGLLLHYQALRLSKHRLDTERQQEIETTQDRTRYTCGACGLVDRAQVRERTVGAWGHDGPVARLEALVLNRGPNLCDACFPVVEQELRDRRRARAAELAAELVDGTSRRDLVARWIDGHVERILSP
jgi:hypothetical protein